MQRAVLGVRIPSRSLLRRSSPVFDLVAGGVLGATGVGLDGLRHVGGLVHHLLLYQVRRDPALLLLLHSHINIVGLVVVQGKSSVVARLHSPKVNGSLVQCLVQVYSLPVLVVYLVRLL